MESGPAASYAGRLLVCLGAQVLRAAAAEPAPFTDTAKDTVASHTDQASLDDLLSHVHVDGVVDGRTRAGRWPRDLPHVHVPPDPDPLVDWATSGLMWLTGHPHGAPVAGPAALIARARGAAATVELLAGARGSRLEVNGPLLLGERAALRGGRRMGRVSVGGTCHLLATADAWVAVNLPRPDDVTLLEAWLGIPGPGSSATVTAETWNRIATRIGELPAADVVGQGQELGLAVAPAPAPAEACRDPQAESRAQRFPPAPWLIDGKPSFPIKSRARPAPHGRRRARRSPLVVDLSTLWAGPLCSSLLRAAGARVVKVEGAARPDGGRYGDLRFFDVLNAGKETLALDLREPHGRRALTSLFAVADVVVESFRPRAMEQLGLDPARILERHPSLTWVSITGYGRTGPQRQWSAFGDDAAAAGGLAAVTGGGDRPLHCGDAIADPLTGLHAAAVALAALQDGGGHLVDIAMREVVAHVLGDLADPDGLQASPGRARPAHGSWYVTQDDEPVEVLPPSARPPSGSAPALGRDTIGLAREFGLPIPTG